MEWTRSDVPVGKRVITWVASLALGVSMYFVFGTLLTVGLKRERADVNGKIEAVLAAMLRGPGKVTKDELTITQAKSRAASSHLWDLHRRDERLRQEIKSKEAWAAAIGLVACAGCFALCAVSWISRDDRAGGVLQGASP